MTTYENSDLEVRLHGETAIVTGVNVSAGTDSGRVFRRRLRFTQVWIQRNGEWLRAAFHDTAVDAPGTAPR